MEIKCECNTTYIGIMRHKLEGTLKNTLDPINILKKDSNFTLHLLEEELIQKEMKDCIKLLHYCSKYRWLNILENL